MPSEGIKRPKKKISVEELEDTEIHRVLETMIILLGGRENYHSPKRASGVFCTLAYTGMRAGELLHSEMVDIHF